MTNKKRLISTILCFLAVVFVGILALTATSSRMYAFKVFANQTGNIQVVVSATNAGEEIKVDNDVLKLTQSGDASTCNVYIPDQVFSGAGKDKAIVYNIEVTNLSGNSQYIYINELDVDQMRNVGIDNSYFLNGKDSTNGINLSAGSTFTAQIVVYVVDAGFNVDEQINLLCSISPSR